jgi:GT2 family glycosyltransferase
MFPTLSIRTGPEHNEPGVAPSQTPAVAVVIPTARRETRLAFALEALAGQTLPRERFEVVVVRAEDPGPKAAAPLGLPVRYLSAPAGSGPAEKRNIGWRATSAPLVAFTDDDCRPAPDWLARLVHAAEPGDDLILQGATEPDPDEARRLHGLAVSQRIAGPSGWYETCNIAYPRSLLQRLEGFDQRFAGNDAGDYPVGGEDTDLGLRAVATGAEARFVPGAVVHHAVHSRHLVRALRDTRRWRSVPLVLARHPSQRAALHAGLFGRRAHWALLVAALALPLRRRPLLASAAATPYLDHHLRGYPRTPRGLARGLADLPARALLDGAEIAVTAVAAARHRVAVL